jgi:hypothetical protein
MVLTCEDSNYQETGASATLGSNRDMTTIGVVGLAAQPI